MKRLIFVVGAMMLAAACATTSTPYGPAVDGRGYGFSEQAIDQGRYRITFRGNSSTPRETVENSLLYRAAELTVQQGFDYFSVIESDTETRKSYSSTAPAFYGRYGYGYPFYRSRYSFPYYAYGFGWGSPYDSFATREITRYSAVAFVAMFKGDKPEDDPSAFDAREVLSNLGPVVIGQPAVGG